MNHATPVAIVGQTEDRLLTKYRGILFDKDGTLFSFAETWSGWAQRFFMDISGGHREQASKLAAAVGYDFEMAKFERDSMIIAQTPGEIADELVKTAPDLSREYVLTRMNELAGEVSLVQVVDLPALLSRFARHGLKLGIATNDSEVPARANMEQLGVTAQFDFIAGFDSGFGAKPAPGMLLAFANQFDLDPADCIMVGDSTHDLHAGRAAGMATVAVLTGLADEIELGPHADVVLPDIGHLPDWMNLPE